MYKRILINYITKFLVKAQEINMVIDSPLEWPDGNMSTRVFFLET